MQGIEKALVSMNETDGDEQEYRRRVRIQGFVLCNKQSRWAMMRKADK